MKLSTTTNIIAILKNNFSPLCLKICFIGSILFFGNSCKTKSLEATPFLFEKATYEIQSSGIRDIGKTYLVTIEFKKDQDNSDIEMSKITFKGMTSILKKKENGLFIAVLKPEISYENPDLSINGANNEESKSTDKAILYFKINKVDRKQVLELTNIKNYHIPQ